MNKFLVIAGNILFALGIVLMTPLADWLPIDAWFGSGDGDAAQDADYMRVVPGGDRPTWLFLIFIIVGFFMVLIGRLRMRQ